MGVINLLVIRGLLCHVEGSGDVKIGLLIRVILNKRIVFVKIRLKLRGLFLLFNQYKLKSCGK